MIFNVSYSAEARQDLRDIYEYIAYELLVPETAARQAERIMKAARSLEQIPMLQEVLFVLCMVAEILKTS